MRSSQFDPVAGSAKFVDHFLSALLLDILLTSGHRLVADSDMQDLPDQATTFVSNYPNRLLMSLMSQARCIYSGD